jgi:hypothetical protein
VVPFDARDVFANISLKAIFVCVCALLFARTHTSQITSSSSVIEFSTGPVAHGQ